MTIIPEIKAALKKILITKPREYQKSSGFIQRQRQVTGESFAQTLILGWLKNPQATLENLCQIGHAFGLHLSPQGLEQRFTVTAADFLRQLLSETVQEVIKGQEIDLAVLRPFKGVRIVDSSLITLPKELVAIWQGFGGSEGASPSAVKLSVGLEIKQGQLDGPYLVHGTTHDRVALAHHSQPEKGELWLADLGYWSLDYLQELSERGVYWLSRLKHQVCFYDQAGQKWHSDDFLAQQRTNQWEVQVFLGANQKISARLLGLRVPPEVAAQRRRQVREYGRKKGVQPTKALLRQCDWTLLVTNIPADCLSFEAILTLKRIRWQIECLFDLWKTIGGIDKSVSGKPYRILCELYAKLIGQILQHWFFLMSNWHLPYRSLEKAAYTVRDHVFHLGQSLYKPALLEKALTVLMDCLAHGCRINKSQQKPSLYQLLFAFEPEKGLS